jgi:hypothetical protein
MMREAVLRWKSDIDNEMMLRTALRKEFTRLYRHFSAAKPLKAALKTSSNITIITSMHCNP